MYRYRYWREMLNRLQNLPPPHFPRHRDIAERHHRLTLACEGRELDLEERRAPGREDRTRRLPENEPNPAGIGPRRVHVEHEGRQ